MIGGAGGMGKSWLAVHWAHRRVDHFPDGQLYVDLRGFDPSGEPMPTAVAMRGFLDALGVEPAHIPPDPAARVGLYRSLLVGRRMLIVLDNAADTAQLVSLIPGSPSCAVLITSRRRLTGVLTAHGGTALDLDVLPAHEAHELLTHHIGGGRLTAEPDATAELLHCCAGLPLALSVVAARVRTHPSFPLSVLAGELRDQTSRLDALGSGDLTADIRSVLSYSEHALSPGAAAVLALLGLAVGPDLSLRAAASLTALSNSNTRSVLRELENAHLVRQHAPDRFRMHDLIRLYCTERANHGVLSERARADAKRRLIDFYLHAALAADHVLEPDRPHVEVAGTTGPTPPPADPTAALAWFTAEHANLIAIQRLAITTDLHDVVWQLAWALDVFLVRQGHFPDSVRMWRAGLASAGRSADHVVRAVAHRRLGCAHANLGEHREGVHHLEQALALVERADNREEQAYTHHMLGFAWKQQGDHRRSLDHAINAMHLFEGLDLPARQADVLNAVGEQHARLGDYDRGRGYCEAALTLARSHGNEHVAAGVLDNLGHISHLAGHHEDALDYYRESLSICRELGFKYYEADILDRSAQISRTLGRHHDARRLWQLALALYQALYRIADADRVQQELLQLE
ncbi:tetratricopeptide repeat protein [Actinokineospora globicatena]|uniref:tetratricopeptide repeat protein n=1 Tax=Actinokineospora globicatena TaxID=103729 RepID=UPI0020A454A3|nr:tetratricopeptide repeat protein [Actinokineospora globicatena]GLW80169.1 hypothetical protein Aglo01_46500 [Actinokineospora globicatena]GLW86998.1 hypothetical protein Aglo02_46370 [Actinokineospora globicatena]